MRNILTFISYIIIVSIPVLGNDNSIVDKLNLSSQARNLLNELISYSNDNNIYNTILSIDTAKPTHQPDDKRWYLSAIHAYDALKIASGKGVIIAVLDTGIDYKNPFWIDKLWINSAEDINHNGIFDEDDINGIDDDGNGYVDDVIGYNFVDKPVIIQGDEVGLNPNPMDRHGHGTQVASVITSIAPDAKIMAIRTHDISGNSEAKDIANAIVYAVLNGANVINISSGEYDDSPLLHTAIKFAYAMNCVIVASAGNDGKTIHHYPSDYNEVISVGGCNEKLERRFNYGDRLTITAPGSGIYVTSLNDEQKYNNGTSFSAPIVSAVVALLLEKDKTLSPTDVKGILQTSATQVTSGWTPQFGAGIVNAYAALQNVAKTKVEISSPVHNTAINISKYDSILIIGSTITPLMDKWLVRISDDNKKWDTVSGLFSTAVMDEPLCSISTSIFDKNISDSLKRYIISLTINLKNGNTFEDRIHISICSDTTNLKITDFAIYQPFYYSYRIPLFNIKTSIPTSATIYYREKDNTDTNYYAILSNEYITTNHLVMANAIPIWKEVEGYVEVSVPNSGLIVRREFVFNRIADHFDSYTFIKKSYSLDPSYLYKSVFEKDKILASHYNSEVGVENLYTYQLKDSKIIAIDSTNNFCYAQGFGDSNGDGVIELMTGYYGVSSLLQDNTEIFSTDNYDALYCEGMFDFDEDGNEELLFCDNMQSFYVFSYKNNKYQLMLQANINNLMKGIDSNKYSLRNGFAIGNFYGDGKNYVALTTTPGNYLLIIDISNFQPIIKDYYRLEHPYFREILTQTPIVAGDIDNDGKDEIVYLTYGKINDSSGVLGKTEIWTYKVFAIENNKISLIFEDDIFGVRNNSQQRNAVNIGNLDNSEVNEVVISAFPNLYVLKWDAYKRRLFPMWSCPASNTNAIVIGDFDSNGRQELCFTTFNNNEFYEFNQEYTIGLEASYVSGWAISSTAAHFEWKGNENVEYELWLFKTEDLDLKSVYSTNTNAIDIMGLQPNTSYSAYVAVSGTNYFSQPITITTKSATMPLSATTLNLNIVKIKYSERLQQNIEPASYSINNQMPIGCVSLISDSAIALIFDNDLSYGHHTIVAKSITDCYGNPTICDTLYFTISTINKDVLYLNSLEFEPPLTLYVSFSEPVNSIEATDIDNYKLYPYGKIDNISKIDSTKIKIILSDDIRLEGRGKDYLITANTNIVAVSGQRMTSGAGNTLGWTLAEKNINNIYVYPNPIRLSTHDFAYIGHLTSQAKIEIFDMNRKLLRTLEEYDGNGGIGWNLRDANNVICEVGIYLVRVTDITTNSIKYCKFAITQ